MSDSVIQVKGLSKVYRLYREPHHRLLDVMGLLRGGQALTFPALHDLDLEVKRGERIAIIGRNGAGKSTLLKLITKVIRPTGGRLEVRGKVHALLQIGAGFHPDFTGRENALSYLAQLGITGEKAAGLARGAIEFAEIENYADQPMRTYSTGMGARLMFAISTAVVPDILILDEVLGVGDSYFARKSFDRIREMCAQEGTTTLLVSHDVYAAVRLASRVIWLDRGRIVRDGDGNEVARAYEESIRLQEEERLRAKAMRSPAPIVPGKGRILIEARTADGHPPKGVLEIAHFRLDLPDGGREEAPILEESVAGSPGIMVEGSAWGELATVDQRRVRVFRNHGSPLYRVAVALDARVDVEPSSISCALHAEAPCDLEFRVFSPDGRVLLGRGHFDKGWSEVHSDLVPVSEGLVPAEKAQGPVFGVGSITIEKTRVLNEKGEDARIFHHGRRARFEFDLAVVDPAFDDSIQVAVSLYREEVPFGVRIFGPEIRISAASGRKATLSVTLDALPLGEGVFSISAQLVRAGYYEKEQSKFFSINSDVIFAMSRYMEIRVLADASIAQGALCVLRGDWDVRYGDAPALEENR
ncbi:MAG: ATP-binding cassette domain-containing protein [Vicinamibacteria bacterium]|nr:ATP-binding cassette domain-containing protein [Vicinamibacteria bacterium]